MESALLPVWSALSEAERLWAAAFAGSAVALLAFRALAALIRRPPAPAAPASELEALAARLSALADGQQRLSGGLTQAVAQIGDAAQRAQTETLRLVEERLAVTLERVGGGVSTAAERTAQSLGDLSARLEAIDRAQANLEKLSGDMLGLQQILAGKQTRGAFGEIQLYDLISQTLPPDAYATQVTLSNNRRPDALLKLPHPPGPIAIDAKFPLEGYEALSRARADRDPAAIQSAERAFRGAVSKHLSDIAERYILPEETADGALMFLPSEAVYAELHARFPEIVRKGFEARVYVVSPTTLMATLHTVRAILKDARLRDEADQIRLELGGLAKDVAALGKHAGLLRSRLGQAEGDLAAIDSAAGRALGRLRRIDGIDGIEDQTAPPAAPLPDAQPAPPAAPPAAPPPGSRA